MEVENVEKTYQKKTQLEHILLRPDTYIGTVEQTNQNLYILSDDEQSFINKNIEFVPGLYKIFDEVLVNAADNVQRDKKMDQLRVQIDRKSIQVWNNGKTIPIQIHKEYNIYVSELVFGHLLTGSNYDDSVKKVTGGRNGFGAKLTNIFSKKFVVENGDSKKGKKFKMTWTQNMSKKSDPEISDFDENDFTCVTFEPDFKRFGMAELSDDEISLMKKRVYDMAGVLPSHVKVYLNGKKLPITNFQSYVGMYLNEGAIKIQEKCKSNRWEVVVSISEGQFQQVSFANAICTSRGGTHVNMITDQITDRIMEALKKKQKNIKVKPFQIKQHLWVFVNSLIENPTFDSQTKETLTLKPSAFGSKCELSDKFIKEILKCGILDQIILQAQAKEEAKMAKKLTGQKKSRLLGIPKLEDANLAGTKNADQCTLILTEGDSAKNLAISGIEIVGRDKYGVFPLKGKLLNVRDAQARQISDNQEIQNIIKIMGLQFGKKYENTKNLRYGSIMIMADQDHDGSHIKGLLINFIHNFWPSLIHMNGFLKQFVTPLIKVTNKRTKQQHAFFTVQDFKNWANTIGHANFHSWQIKYYKGLGTSTDKEAKEYFNQIVKHQISFKYANQEDDSAIDLAFNKKKADDRKDWLTCYDPELYVDHSIKHLRYHDFVHKELVQFSIADNLRSIPSSCDGLKPGQRKILFACFKRNLKDEIKVAQLSGYVAEHSAYHHGEQSLAQTIIGMAQDFVGSNNINLLMPIGQFGSRNMGGKESASARYIFTQLNKITRAIFPEDDDHSLKYLEDDGQFVEPQYYIPILPLVLVNGAEGIGTGWSTAVQCYNPKDLVEQLKKKIDGEIEQFEELQPWFRGFKGEIVPQGNNKGGYLVKGIYNEIDDDVIEITELPIKKWTRDYKTFLEGRLEAENGVEPDLEDIKEYHTGNQVNFQLKFNQGKLNQIEKSEGIEKSFKLSTSIQTSNMVLFDQNGKIKKYQTTSEIMSEFYELRLGFYEKRKQYLISKIQRDVELLKNKTEFILQIINGQLIIQNVKKSEILSQLIKKGFRQLKDIQKIKSTKPNQVNTENHDENDDNDASDLSKQYNYLLSMPLWNLSYEKVEEYKNELKKKEHELIQLQNKRISQMWKEDLDYFLQVYSELYKENGEQQNVRKAPSRNQFLKQKESKPVAIKKKKQSELWADSEIEEDLMDIEEDEDEVIPKSKKRGSTAQKLKDQRDILNSQITQNTFNSETDTLLSEKKNEQSTKKKLQKNSKILSETKNDSKKNKNHELKSQSAVSNDNNSKKNDKNTLMENQKRNEVESVSTAQNNKFQLNQSILKYLKPIDTNKVNNINLAPKNDSLLSLEERLLLREKKGQLKEFEDSYKTTQLKNSPFSKQLSQNYNMDENKENNNNLIDEILNKKRPFDQIKPYDKIEDDFLNDFIDIELPEDNNQINENTNYSLATNSANLDFESTTKKQTKTNTDQVKKRQPKPKTQKQLPVERVKKPVKSRKKLSESDDEFNDNQLNDNDSIQNENIIQTENGSRPKRQAAINRKKLIVEDDSGDDDKSKSVPDDQEEEYLL